MASRQAARTLDKGGGEAEDWSGRKEYIKIIPDQGIIFSLFFFALPLFCRCDDGMTAGWQEGRKAGRMDDLVTED